MKMLLTCLVAKAAAIFCARLSNLAYVRVLAVFPPAASRTVAAGALNDAAWPP